MQNVSKNMFKDSDDSNSEIDSEDERLEGWKPPTAAGVDNSKALTSYEDIASGNVRVLEGYTKTTVIPRVGILLMTTTPDVRARYFSWWQSPGNRWMSPAPSNGHTCSS